ncbi:MAG TPA: DUF5671 domain-containing protein [Kiritimatiellia bacterium]|nr:DUF5671 domain-containing protein [Kiritimatiellia bacterium]
MTAQTVRRIYTYVAACVGLQMLVGGAVGLLSLLVERWLGGAPIAAPAAVALRVGGSVALVAVGAPLWAAHWALARRDARQPEGQRSALRRLYLYAVLLVAALTGMFGLQSALGLALENLGQARGLLPALDPLSSAAVAAGVWLAHWRVAGADRDLVEPAGPCATLRRWYLALTMWVSLALASFGAGVLMHGLLQRFVFAAPGSPRQLAMPAAALAAGLLIWLPHELWSRRLVRAPGPLRADELGAALRHVYPALVMLSGLVAALTGLTALLAAGLRAALGAATWAGALAEETRAAAAVVVALPVLLYHREQLVATARLSGAAERVGAVRRALDYLVGAVSLAALYFGLGGLAGTLLRLWLGAGAAAGAGAWRTPLSWYAATTMVALPVFLLAARSGERRARRSPDEELALARRIYLYAGLLFGVIATVVTATGLVGQAVVALLGQGGAGAAGEIGRLAAYTALGGAIAAAFALLLRRAGAARGTVGAGWRIAVVAGEPLCQSLEAALAHELPGAAVVALEAADTPGRRAALAGADLLIETPAALGDPALGAFEGPRLLLAAPLAGATLVGARREGRGLAREAARKARALALARPGAPAPPATALTPTPA